MTQTAAPHPRIIFQERNFPYSVSSSDCPRVETPGPNIEPTLFADRPYVTGSGPRVKINRDHTGYYSSSSKFSVINRRGVSLLDEFMQPKLLREISPDWSAALGEHLVAATTSVMVQRDILELEDIAELSHNEWSETLTSWLHITDRCNLRCQYCYLPHAKVTMTPETGVAAIEAMIRSAKRFGYTKIVIKYGGGEPLLEADLILTLHNYALQRSLEAGLALDGLVLTNGTLLSRSVVSRLMDVGLKTVVSIDSLDWASDPRPFVSGLSSSDVVQRTIERAKLLGLPIDATITVSEANVRVFDKVVEWLLRREIPFQINFERARDSSIDGFKLIEEELLIDGMLAAFQKIEANPPRYSVLGRLLDKTDLEFGHQHACGAGRDYLVFDHTGNISSCQMLLGRPISSLHSRNPLKDIRDNRQNVINLAVDGKEDCRRCDWRYWCAGGCPLMTRRFSGSFAAKSPYCNVYKRLFPEVLRLEGVRLLEHLS